MASSSVSPIMLVDSDPNEKYFPDVDVVRSTVLPWLTDANRDRDVDQYRSPLMDHDLDPESRLDPEDTDVDTTFKGALYK